MDICIQNDEKKKSSANQMESTVYVLIGSIFTSKRKGRSEKVYEAIATC